MAKDVLKVAELIVELMNRDDEGHITNMALNKLLYFSQGQHLARTDEPLFDDNIEAWKHGPVIRQVYNTYKPCGSNNIEPNHDGETACDFSDEEIETIIATINEYGKYSASALVSMTHKPGSPWDIVYDRNNSLSNKTISNKLIREYFLKNEPIPNLIEKAALLPAEEIQRDPNGIWILPKEEYEDWGEFDAAE